MSAYFLDTNFFIEAHRKSYPLDVASGFWLKLSELAREGLVRSIDKVRNEIYNNDDELKNWCLGNLPEDFFIDSSIECVSEYAMLANWAV